jgi:prepilin-type processing-associated H-X9-DG protein
VHFALDGGAGDAATINNIVSDDLTVQALRYLLDTNAVVYHNTQLAEGKTLTVDNASGTTNVFLVGAETTVPSGKIPTTTISGLGGTLAVNAPLGPVIVRNGGISMYGGYAKLDLSGLGTFKATAKQTQCASNQRQIGLGWLMYVQDNNDTYPLIRGWGAAGGQRGKLTPTTAWLELPFGTAVDATNRPLNKYVAAIETWRCPSDHGDANYGAKNCYLEYGSSYVTQHGVDSWRTAHVTADTDPAFNAAGAKPIKANQVARSPVNKIIQGDWEWENNDYPPDDPSAWWHNNKGQRRQNMLFADGHVVFFKFPEEIKNWIYSPPPDPTFLWW